MKKGMRAALAILAISATAAASAQSSLDDALSTANRLLEGAGENLVFDTGKRLEGQYSRMSRARTAGRCSTKYELDYPDIEELPSEYRGSHRSGDIDWTQMSAIEAAGPLVYYNAVGNISGKVRRFHMRFGSPSQAQAFAEAAKLIVDACTGGGDDDDSVDEQVIDSRGNVASLAIDRRNGNRYGWAVDYESINSADRRALSECGRDGSSCQVVLRFTGGCGAYAADTARGSTVYGWGTAPTRAAAENRAHSEARKRGGTNIVTRVWGCNSTPNRANSASASTAAAEAAQEARAERERQFQEELRKHEAAVREHEAAVQRYREQIEANETALRNSAERGRAAQAEYEAELAKARAAQEQYERQRQAYREEYKRLTGKYPDQN